MEIYMFLFHAENERISTLRDFIQQEVLNHRDFPEDMSHQIAFVRFRPTQLCRDVITNSYCVKVIRQSYDISSTNQKRTHKLFFPINLSEVSAFW